jgi:nucleotidyltransferase substrate binding protein (TIGR01987 family)
MERLKERLSLGRRALATLREALAEPKTSMNRDASIQRFEYSYEAVWKAAQLHVSTIENVEAGSPTSVARACFRAGVLTEDQARTVLAMARDRNLTVHTYNEDLADRIYSCLPAHAALMEAWLDAMESAAGQGGAA